MRDKLSVFGYAFSRPVVILACFLLLSSGCGHKEEDKPQEAGASEAQVNAHTSENVFEEYLRKVKNDPKNVDNLYHLADLYDRNAQYEQAVETFAKVIALKPDMGYAYLKMGTAYSRINQPEKAIAILKDAAAHLPNNPVVMNNLGIAYGKLGHWDEEIAALKKAIAIRSRYASARYNLGLTYLKKGNLAAARAEYQALNEFDGTMAQELLKQIEAGK
ncbi:MAG: tetratricopeptide repeat protein [Desulfobulbaceae bacterium]|nr:tetratricopeptide repeat protein [Desulfobulbaceae bacterium]